MIKLLSILSFLSLICFLPACSTKVALHRDQQLIDELVASSKDEVDACYKEAISENPQIKSGKLLVRAEHLPDGSFGAIRPLKTFAGSKPIFECVQNIVSQWKTERPYTRGPVDLIWKFENKNG